MHHLNYNVEQIMIPLRLIILSLFCLLLSTNLIYAQPNLEDFGTHFRVKIAETSESITIDGKLDEKVWQTAEVATNFYQKLPYFKENADPLTEIRMTYDEDNIYVAAKCYQTDPVIIQSLKRDDYWDNDAFGIVMDPLNTKANAYLFGCSAAGVQWDALRSETSGINSDWSNKWFAEVQVEEEFWTAEVAIPFRILRYSENISEWGINFIRNAVFKKQFHNWTAVPEAFWPPNPAYAGNLIWDKSPTRKKGNFNLIPYVTGGLEKQVDENLNGNFNAGIDAKIGITSTLNLDLTLNPDFSQIEVDELVTNLTRFSIFLPEKRTFFLENSDIFGDYGFGAVRPFFSRTIGLDGNGLTVPILYGARLNGNLTNDLRIGVMNIHSSDNEDTPGQNNSAISLQKKFGRSFIQGMVLNRQAFEKSEMLSDDFGRNTSVEAAYISDSGMLSTWVGAHHSFKKGITNKTGFYNLGINAQNTNWEFLSDFVMMQDNYFADMGFVARIENYDAARDTVIRHGFKTNNTSLLYKIRPKEGRIQQHSIVVENLIATNSDWSFNENNVSLGYRISMKEGQSANVNVRHNAVDLLYPFSFAGEGDPLPVDRYNFVSFDGGFESDNRKAFSFDIGAQTGGFYNGRLSRLILNLNYRAQPWGNFSLGYQINDIDFPDPYGKDRIGALRSKIEIGFSRNLIWTTLFQYVDQAEFMGINSRLQWRFSPMSDVFLVFLDNYDVFDLMDNRKNVKTNNRALVLKVNYWY